MFRFSICFLSFLFVPSFLELFTNFQEWFYDELAMEEMETGEEPEDASDEDYYDDTYANRRRKRGAPATGPGSRGGRTRKALPEDMPAKRGRAVSCTFITHRIMLGISYRVWGL